MNEKQIKLKANRLYSDMYIRQSSIGKEAEDCGRRCALVAISFTLNNIEWDFDNPSQKVIELLKIKKHIESEAQEV